MLELRKIKALHKAVYEPIADLVTYRAMPTSEVAIDALNPFLFLNHHGPQVYPPHNHGLPFGPHPHRGFETVTFILDGDLMHKDTGGAESIIKAGGVQWMTAGRGLIHAELSSEEFMRDGGPLEILQLWVNLPASRKFVTPNYVGLQSEEIPSIQVDDGRVSIDLVSGKWGDNKAAFTSETGLHINLITFKSQGALTLDIPDEDVILFYVIRGELQVHSTAVQARTLVEFDHSGSNVNIVATKDSILLLGYAKPLAEPVVAYGPFVMNTEQEIRDAYADYHQGKFGNWQE